MEAIPWIVLSMFVCIIMTVILRLFKAVSKQDKRIARMIARRESKTLNVKDKNWDENIYK